MQHTYQYVDEHVRGVLCVCVCVCVCRNVAHCLASVTINNSTMVSVNELLFKLSH